MLWLDSRLSTFPPSWEYYSDLPETWCILIDGKYTLSELRSHENRYRMIYEQYLFEECVYLVSWAVLVRHLQPAYRVRQSNIRIPVPRLDGISDEDLFDVVYDLYGPTSHPIFLLDKVRTRLDERWDLSERSTEDYDQALRAMMCFRMFFHTSYSALDILGEAWTTIEAAT